MVSTWNPVRADMGITAPLVGPLVWTLTWFPWRPQPETVFTFHLFYEEARGRVAEPREWGFALTFPAERMPCGLEQLSLCSSPTVLHTPPFLPPETQAPCSPALPGEQASCSLT